MTKNIKNYQTHIFILAQSRQSQEQPPRVLTGAGCKLAGHQGSRLISVENMQDICRTQGVYETGYLDVPHAIMPDDSTKSR